jgi:2-keto-4-pentenoate hydratase/2-oxohepta-3-ene-1,7-dioic acid hydratase in catechol pathway
MDNSRRDFLKLGVTAATVGALLPPGSAQAAAGTAGGPIPNAASDKLRLVTFAPDAKAAPRVGVVDSAGRVIDIGAAARRQSVRLGFDPTRMASLIAANHRALKQVMELAERGDDGARPLDSVRLLPPIPNPTRNVYAVGWNYLAHFQEGQAMREVPADAPEHPVFFSKAVHTINGPYDAIPYDPQVSTLIDWECELAVVLGKRGRNIPEAEAMNYVFGFMVINDTSARDLQLKKHGGQWFKGKSLDGHGPIGPWIIPAAQLDYNNLHLLTRVNGVVKQDANTQQMYFKVPRIVSELSQGLTIEPGDIIATGTPPGIGHARTPPEYLKPGDVMETEIAEIGVLRNSIQLVQA